MAAAGEAGPDRHQLAIGLGTVAVGGVLAAGATHIPHEAGYAGIGPDFLPWLVAVVLIGAGALLSLKAWRGGWRDLPEPSGAARGDWLALAWVSAGVLADAALITSLGFVLANALCYTLAVRGLRLAEGRAGGGLRTTATDVLTGLLIAAPVYWLFGRLLAIRLPGLTETGWL